MTPMQRKFLRCLKQPFEIHYDTPVKLQSMDFCSTVSAPTRFLEVNAVLEEVGFMENLAFECLETSGVELAFCLLNLHRGVNPEWLTMINEEGMFKEVTEARYHQVSVKEGRIHFQRVLEEEMVAWKNLWAFGEHFLSVDLTSASPKCFVLDSYGDRIMVGSEGFLMDSEGTPNGEHFFVQEELRQFAFGRWGVLFDELSLDPVQAKRKWIRTFLEMAFPMDRELELGDTTP
jgi:hypothetical protein